MKYFTILFLLTLPLLAQSPAKLYPHPFAEASLALNGGGYSPIGARGSVGLDIEGTHYIGRLVGSYGTAKKSDDGTVGNDKGHQNTGEGNGYFRFSNGFFVGGGFGRTQLSTTNYSKSHDFIKAGLGRDVIGDYHSFRVQGEYLRAINEKVKYPDGSSCIASYCTNGISGVDINFYYPSPSLNKHFFLHSDFEAIVFHNYRQTTHAVASFGTTGFLVRF